MKKINKFFILVLILYAVNILSMKDTTVYSQYKLVTIQNDFIIISHKGNDVKLFPKDKYKNIIVDRILYSYAVINKKEFRIGDIIKTKHNIPFTELFTG